VAHDLDHSLCRSAFPAIHFVHELLSDFLTAAK
jgi:hypothetical protein